MDFELHNDQDQNACRLCDKHANQMHSIFEKTIEGDQILQLIRKFLPIIVYRTDPLPKQVCESCLLNLKSLHSFHETALGTAKKQQERLKLNGNNQDSVHLYLEQVDSRRKEKLESRNALTQKTVDRTTSPVENGERVFTCSGCKKPVAGPESSEIEMCAELHKAIADSLKNSNQHLGDDNSESATRNVVLRNKRKRNEGFYAEYDESQDSSVTTDFTYTESTQNTESQSDMELCESDQEYAGRIVTKEEITPVAKRRRLMGPKSVQEHNAKLQLQRLTEMEETVVFNPLSLLRLSLNSINSRSVPDHRPPWFAESVLRSVCNYCRESFGNVKLLAVHEAGHMNIEMGVRIDDGSPWDERRDDADVRNKWLEKFQEESEEENEDEEVDGGLLVPVASSTVKGEITLVNGKATVNGVPLIDIPKDERRQLYRTVTISGLKRKFCPLCRYTFKDNWAIESHYFSSSCYYTCRYCGIRFNKQRYQFDEHVTEHENKGDEVSTKMFAPRKYNTAYPRIINDHQTKPRLPPKPRPAVSPKVKPMDMKHLIERKSLQPNLRVKPDVIPDNGGKAGGGTPSNQAYFCRKCYQVFFKLDEFNIHIKTCSGSPQINYNASTPTNSKPTGGSSTQNSLNNASQNSFGGASQNSSDAESYSATGRPIRHCVREVHTYKDELDLEEIERQERRLSGRGYECAQCNTVFPTVHSRNSHMRVHRKNDYVVNNQVNNVVKNNAVKEEIPTFEHYVNEPQIKQEPLEPIVEINENPHNFPSSIGSVSITPIPKPAVNPNIMKLVQNNPHLTIKSMGSNGGSTPSGSLGGGGGGSPGGPDADKTYKCANCSRSFGNKSHLYFHKKNQCGGSKYPCPFCKKRFGTEAAYSSHIFYSHPE